MSHPAVRRAHGLAVVGVALSTAGVVLVAAQAQPEAHLYSIALLAGIAAFGTAVLLLAPARRTATNRLAQRLMGAAALTWGVGHLLSVRSLDDSTTYPASGDLVTICAAPLAAGALLSLARSRVRSVDLARVALDALLLGTAASLLAWRLFFRSDGLTYGPTLLVCTVLVIDLVLLAVLLLLWLRDLDKGMLVTLGGAWLYVAGDVTYVHVLLQGGLDWPWQAAALWGLGWPIVGVGLVLVRPSPVRASRERADRDRHHTEARTTAGVTAGGLLLLIGTIASVLGSAYADPVTSWLALLVVVVLGIREVVLSLQRHGMLRRLTELAYQDPLTRLGNRRALTALLETDTRSTPASVLTLDLDGFKEVNDMLGHDRGDQLLAAVARHLSRSLPADCDAFRIGGDEFAVVVPGTVERAQGVAEDLLVAVRAAAGDVPGANASTVSASVGVATLTAAEVPCTSPDAAAAGADVLTGLTGSGVALRAAKAAGRNRVELYDGPVAAAHRRDLLVERRLRAAIDSGAVVPHYQPIVNLGTRMVVGVEALARWDDEVLGRVAPDEFIPVAERSNQIVALGASVLRQAIHDLAQAVTSDGSLLRVGVNASVVQLRRPGFADAVLEHLQESGFDPSCLIIEVTESLFVDVDDPAVRELHTLRAGGVHVAIDDFGSGYSSLAYLARMPADVLKIDRGLTAQVLYDERSRVVLQAIVSLAKSLPMDVVVEGVESAAVHDLVRDLGGEYGQGWLYGAAVPFPRLADAMADIDARAQMPLLLPLPHQTG